MFYALILILSRAGLTFVSFTPGFSPVLDRRDQQKTVSTVFRFRAHGNR